MQGKAYVGEKLAAEAVVTCQLVDRSRAEGKSQAEPQENSGE
jgi:hypothetical protein